MKKQKFDFLLALDFEATCDNKRKIQPQEIIEFPCIKIQTKNFNMVEQFHMYVKPKHNPQITEFCTELTGILQETVESQPEFPEVFARFEEWLQPENENFAFVTCGDWDLKTCLPNQCKTSDLQLPKWAKHWINLKIASMKTNNGHFPRSMAEILRTNDLKFEGRPHSGIDDTKNIVNAIKALALKGCVFEYTT